MKTRTIFYILIISTLIFTSCKRSLYVTPERKDIVDAVFASGKLVMSERYLVTSMTEGYLDKSFVEAGDSVKEGGALFSIYDETQRAQLEDAMAVYAYALENSKSDAPVLQKLEAQRSQYLGQLANDSLTFKRYANLVRSHAVSQAEYDRAKLAYENSRKQLEALEQSITDTKRGLELDLVKARAALVAQQNASSYYAIHSRTDGLVLQKMKEEGELVRRGETLAEIGSGEYLALLYIAEEDIRRIAEDQKVFIELNTDKNHSYPARITRIYPAFNNQEQSFLAEARFTEPIEGLHSGTQLQANIVVAERLDALVIPTMALMPGNKVRIAGSTTSHVVEPGLIAGDWVEIRSGLKEGESVHLTR